MNTTFDVFFLSKSALKYKFTVIIKQIIIKQTDIRALPYHMLR